MSWGNAFDFASRAGLFPAGLPTVVWTAHTAEAFSMAWRLTGEEQYAEVVRAAGRFVSEALERHEDADGLCIGYAPGLLTLVHNSNLLGAVTLLRAVNAGAPGSYVHVAYRAIRWSVSQMNRDGSWCYGEGPQYQWIDNLHTAYVLDCLCSAQALGGENAVTPDVVERTYQYWHRMFFEDGGRPHYYDHRTYPIDIQCCAQAIETGCRVAHLFPDAAELAERVAAWTLRAHEEAQRRVPVPYRPLPAERPREPSLGGEHHAIGPGALAAVGIHERARPREALRMSACSHCEDTDA